MPPAFWVCAAITLISAAIGFGYAVAGIRAVEGATRTPSAYALARSSALLAVALVAWLTDSVGFLAAVALAMILVQAIDAAIGAVQRDRAKTIGPVVVAAINLAALIWLLAGR